MLFLWIGEEAPTSGIIFRQHLTREWSGLNWQGETFNTKLV